MQISGADEWRRSVLHIAEIASCCDLVAFGGVDRAKGICAWYWRVLMPVVDAR